MSSNNNNNQFSSHNPSSDQQFNNDRLPGNTATSNFAPPSGTHAQQHNLHSLDTPLNQGGTNVDGGALDLEQEAKRLQTDLERSHPHTQTGTRTGNMNRPDQFSQNQGLNQAGGPFSSQPAAHNIRGREMHTGLGTGVSGLGGGAGSEPYATTSVGGAGNNDSDIGYPPTLPGTGMGIGGQQHQQQRSQLHTSNRDLPVPGAVVDHSRDNRDRLDQSKMAQTDVDRDREAREHDEFEGTTAGFNTSGTAGGHTGMHGTTGFGNTTSGTGTHGATGTGFNTSSHGPTSGSGTGMGTQGTAGLGRESHGQHRTGPLEVMGVTGATGRGDTTGHGTTGTGTALGTGTGTHGTGFDSSNRHQTGATTATGLKSTEGRKDGDLLAQDTRATNSGNAAHKPTSEPTGHTKPGIGDKIAGMAEKVQGKITGNPALVAKGEQREQGFGPKN